jgi:hypothetical protein
MEDLADAAPFGTSGPGGMTFVDQNKGVTPIFFMSEALPDGRRSEAEGAARFYQQEMVRIHVAGDIYNTPTHPVTDDIRERFADQYARWKQNRAAAQDISGTPLSNWPMMTPIMIAELAAIGVRSVEDLSAVADSNIHRIQDGRVWREKAKAFLDASKDTGAAVRLAAENERLRADIEELRKAVEDLRSRGDEPEKRGPGRPRKEA